jgi:hypothetical protein
MRKLYMIRLQNGNSVVLQADDERQALEYAGLHRDRAVLAEHLRASGEEVDEAILQLRMMESGLGPQNYTIRELTEFHCAFGLKDDGDFVVGLEDDEALDEFYKDYPELDLAEEQVAEILAASDLEDDLIMESEWEKQLMYAAVVKERTRLTAIL